MSTHKEQLQGKTNRMSIAFFGAAAVVVIIALGVMVWGILQVVNGSASANWPQTTGTVTTSAVKYTKKQSGQEQSISYSANVVYQYSVNGASYTSSQVSFGVNDASASTAQQIVNKYPQGATVKVYYSPDNPKQAVLETGANAGAFVIIGVGALFLIGGLIFGGAGWWLRGVPAKVASGELDASEEIRVTPGYGMERRTVLRRGTKTADDSGSARDWLVPLVITALLAVVGSVALYFGFRDARDAFASPNWPHVQGTVTSFFIEEKEDTDSNNNRTIIRTPRIAYSYQVNGAKYLGDKIGFEDVGSNIGYPASYAEGSTVTVYYSPDDPSRAVLQPGASLSSFFLFGFGLCFAGIGVPGVLSALIRTAQNKKLTVARANA